MESTASEQGRERIWRIWWAAFATLLPLATWPLWFAANPEFPRAPWMWWLGRTPGLLQAAIGLVVIALPWFAALRRLRAASDAALLGYCVSLVALWSMNQHRLQPWSYQFGIIAAVMFFDGWPASRARLRWLTISIYLYSAIGKFDYSYAHTMGAQLVQGPLHALGVPFEDWPEWVQVAAALTPPSLELLAGIGLAFRRTRAMSVWAVIGLHAALLARLGPWAWDTNRACCSGMSSLSGKRGCYSAQPRR